MWQGWLKNAIVGAVNDVANTWSVDSIFNHRENFESNIVVECNKRLIKWFDVSQLRTNITPPVALQESIIAKTRVPIKFTKKDNLGIEFPAEENAGLGFNKNRLTKIIKFLSDKMVDTYYHEITSFKY